MRIPTIIIVIIPMKNKISAMVSIVLFFSRRKARYDRIAAARKRQVFMERISSAYVEMPTFITRNNAIIVTDTPDIVMEPLKICSAIVLFFESLPGMLLFVSVNNIPNRLVNFIVARFFLL